MIDNEALRLYIVCVVKIGRDAPWTGKWTQSGLDAAGCEELST